MLLCTFTCRFLNGHIFSYRMKEWIARSYGSTMFNLWRNCQIVFQSGCSILHFHQQFQYLHILVTSFLMLSWRLTNKNSCSIRTNSDLAPMSGRQCGRGGDCSVKSSSPSKEGDSPFSAPAHCALEPVAPSCQTGLLKRRQKFGYSCESFQYLYFGNELNKSSCMSVSCGLLFCGEYQKFLRSQTNDVAATMLLPSEGTIVPLVSISPSRGTPPYTYPYPHPAIMGLCKFYKPFFV